MKQPLSVWEKTVIGISLFIAGLVLIVWQTRFDNFTATLITGALILFAVIFFIWAAYDYFTHRNDS